MAVTKDLSPDLQKDFAHLEGDGVVVRTYYANRDQPGTATVCTGLPSDDELGVWADAAFTNGGPLVKIELVWDPAEAEKLKAATGRS